MNALASTPPRNPGLFVELPCQAVLFDCDGVLVDSTADGEAAWTQWAAEYGLDPDRVLEGLHGRRSRDTVELFLPAHQHEDGYRRIEQIEVAGAAGTTALPGAARLLRTLPLKWAVVTSASRKLAETRLRAAGLPLPRVLITAEDVGQGKPAPDGYLRAARELNVAPSACLVVEDSPTGVNAAGSAGATVLGLGERALATRARYVARNLCGVRGTPTSLRIPSRLLLRATSPSRR